MLLVKRNYGLKYVEIFFAGGCCQRTELRIKPWNEQTAVVSCAVTFVSLDACITAAVSMLKYLG